MKLESAIDSFDCSCDKLPSFQQRDSRARLPHSSSSSILLFHPNGYLYHNSIHFL